jgi:hydroxypyruvate isomerase
VLRGLGYRGAFGMEYVPTTETVASLAVVERLAAAAQQQ